MDNKIAILTMAIAAVTMLIALGQLIVAVIALNTKKAPAKASWIGRNFNWLMAALFYSLSVYGMWRFYRGDGAPTREDIFDFSIFVFLMGATFTNVILELVLRRLAKGQRYRDEHIALLTDEVRRLGSIIDAKQLQ